MGKRGLNITLWVLSVVITLALVIYQRATGPTYPIRGEIEIAGEVIDYKLIRTFGGEVDAQIILEIENENVTGDITLKRFKSYDEWSTSDMYRNGNELIGIIPGQPMAGKVEYIITLYYEGNEYQLTEEPVIIRFKGLVPQSKVAPHIFFMFMSL